MQNNNMHHCKTVTFLTLHRVWMDKTNASETKTTLSDTGLQSKKYQTDNSGNKK